MSMVAAMDSVEKLARRGFSADAIKVPGLSPKTVAAIVARCHAERPVVDAAAAEDAFAARLISQNPPTPAEIVTYIAAKYDMPVAEFTSRSRHRRLVHMRQEAMYLCVRYTQRSLSNIGEAFDRDHATIGYGAYTYARRNGLRIPRGMTGKSPYKADRTCQ